MWGYKEVYVLVVFFCIGYIQLSNAIDGKKNRTSHTVWLLLQEQKVEDKELQEIRYVAECSHKGITQTACFQLEKRLFDSKEQQKKIANQARFLRVLSDHNKDKKKKITAYTNGVHGWVQGFDDGTIVVAQRENLIAIAKGELGKAASFFMRKAHSGPVTHVSISSDGCYLATLSNPSTQGAPGSFKIWCKKAINKRDQVIVGKPLK